MKREKTMGDVLVALERYEQTITQPLARCPEGAKQWHDRVDGRKADLIETVRLYGLVSQD